MNLKDRIQYVGLDYFFEESKTFCILPWMHMYVNTDSSVWSCCVNKTMTKENHGFETNIMLGAANNAATEVLVTSDTNIIGFIVDSDVEQAVYATSGASRGFADTSKAGSRMRLNCDGSKWLIIDAVSDLAMVTALT